MERDLIIDIHPLLSYFSCISGCHPSSFLFLYWAGLRPRSRPQNNAGEKQRVACHAWGPRKARRHTEGSDLPRVWPWPLLQVTPANTSWSFHYQEESRVRKRQHSSFVHSFAHSLHPYLLRAYCVPGTKVGSGNLKMNKLPPLFSRCFHLREKELKPVMKLAKVIIIMGSNAEQKQHSCEGQTLPVPEWAS